MKLAISGNRTDHQDRISKVRAELTRQLVGQEKVIDRALIAFLAGGHLLLEGPPGVGKTSLARGLAEAFEGSFRRIQMTSDLLPSEIVGVLRPKKDQEEFEFRKGPIFSNFVLADELNRTSPKTQAALLEAMAENHVTVDGQTHALPSPFFVVATQNPLEYHGVYPLVESQLDRFMFQVRVNLPDSKKEMEIYQTHRPILGSQEKSALHPVHAPLVSIGEIQTIQSEIAQIHIAPPVLEYIYEIIAQTRSHESVEAGVSVRGGLLFVQGLRAAAYVRSRDYVHPDDVKDLAVPALAHRLRMDEGQTDWEPKHKVIDEILEKVKKPN